MRSLRQLQKNLRGHFFAAPCSKNYFQLFGIEKLASTSIQNITYRVVQKTDTQFYFCDNFGNFQHRF